MIEIVLLIDTTLLKPLSKALSFQYSIEVLLYLDKSYHAHYYIKSIMYLEVSSNVTFQLCFAHFG